MTLLSSFGFATKTAEDLKKEIEENSEGSSFEPLLKNEFKVTEDGKGSGTVVMRILPAMGTFKVQSPHVALRKHFFSYKGTIYDSLCPGFFNDDCPLCSFIRETGINKKDSKSVYKKFNYGEWENGKPSAPRFSAQEEFWVNVYIKADTVDPSNNNKVFQYRLPKTVYDKYTDYIKGNPSIGESPEEVYDLENGRDLHITYYKNAQGYRTYDNSKFGDRGPIKNVQGEILYNNPEDFMRILEDMEDLHVLIDPDERLYDKETSKEKFDEVMETIEEELRGGEGGSFSSKSKDISDGFDNVELKKKESGNVTKKEMDELTSGALDSVENDPQLEAIMNADSNMADDFGEIEDLLNE